MIRKGKEGKKKKKRKKERKRGKEEGPYHRHLHLPIYPLSFRFISSESLGKKKGGGKKKRKGEGRG